jgi:hypothetical protein
VAEGRRVVGGRSGRGRDLLDARPPGAGQRDRTCSGVQAQRGGIAVEAAAAAGVGDAHGDPVRPRAQQARGHGIAARLLPAALAADTLAVDPDLVAIVHHGQVQRGRSGRLAGAEFDPLAQPDDTVQVGQALAFPHARRLQRRPVGVDVCGGGPVLCVHAFQRQARLPRGHEALQAIAPRGAEAGVVGRHGAHRGGEVGVLQSGVAAHPGLQHGAAPGGVDQADGHALHRLHLAREVVADGAELADLAGLGDDPGRRRDLGLGLHAGAQRHAQVAQLRVLRRGDFLGAGVGGRERPLHVGLAAQQPDVADQYVVQHHGLVALDEQAVRPAGRQRGQLHPPAAIGADTRAGGAAAERHAQRLAGRGLAPQGQRAVALQHHVLAEHMGQSHFGLDGGGEQGQQQGQGGLLHRWAAEVLCLHAAAVGGLWRATSRAP